mmetsp:Transcript_16019/g.15430  ORF Transcript_16019/g.15430 Transcript_16019/m.15430 type:complete len:234 (-) Transcript_16019:774-1475(-)
MQRRLLLDHPSFYAILPLKVHEDGVLLELWVLHEPFLVFFPLECLFDGLQLLNANELLFEAVISEDRFCFDHIFLVDLVLDCGLYDFKLPLVVLDDGLVLLPFLLGEVGGAESGLCDGQVISEVHLEVGEVDALELAFLLPLLEDLVDVLPHVLLDLALRIHVCPSLGDVHHLLEHVILGQTVPGECRTHALELLWRRIPIRYQVDLEQLLTVTILQLELEMRFLFAEHVGVF